MAVKLRQERSPLAILRHARFEVDAEPFPAQQKQAGARRRMSRAQAGPESGRREKQRDEAGFEQHAVRLIAGKILRRADEGKKANEARPPAMTRGQMLKNSSSEAISPTQQTSIKRAVARARARSSVGANQKRSACTAAETACR